MNLYPVIMAGGSGTRFWPLSRAARPKQFLALATQRPLITETALRLKGLAKPKDLFIVCGAAHARSAAKLVPSLPKANLLVEPAARNTAPAIGLAALHVARRDPKGVMVVLPSDHHVADIPGFQRQLSVGGAVAEQGYLVTLGIQPHRPETGYGYIRVGEPIDGHSRKVAAFVEKPDLARAQEYLASGDYLWNGGIFLFRADVILEAFHVLMPELAKGLDTLAAHLGKSSYSKQLAKIFPKLPSVSIDYGVMEKAEKLAVVPGDFGWSDVGSFEAMPEVRKKDAAGNVVSGKGALVLESEGCVVLAGEDRPVAVVGMKDVVVVDAGDAFLVVPKARSQEVRKAVEALRARKLQKYL